MKWFKKNQQQETAPVPEKKSAWTRLQQGLGSQLGRLLLGKKEVDAAVLEALETLLITSDLGIKTTQKLLAQLTEGLERKQLADGDAVFRALQAQMAALISQNTAQLSPTTSDKAPFVILMVGINGAGKTTTMGKLAKLYQSEGKRVMLAAGDTFRAAAVEQLQVWGERSDIPVIAQHTGADSASVVFDAFQAAKARGMDVLIADTAGRLHTQGNLMDELKKVKRVLQKIDANAPHEVMLVLDASIGQNALNQARQFNQAVGVTGITITKLDGTAKGGILFAIANELGLPFRYIGVGEGMDDLRVFDPQHFVQAIFKHDGIQAG
ncbi:MAG: signal recognition particle-docking protein FtsY [Gammaproteobacteria bacterium]|nr:signal recognition particle-docking protein FtsY [Gammaproteobacteria bacterium]